MRLSDFDYELPPGRIAETPAAERDAARLLVHELAADRTRHLRVRDLPGVLAAGDLLVLNDTRVLRARVFARRRSGGRVELFFLEPVPESAAGAWRAMVNPARKPRAGELLAVGAARVRMLERELEADGRPGAVWRITVETEGGAPLAADELFRLHGQLPLPPYIRRTADDPRAATDRERYQTVYAEHEGAVAAPTAGLHFTPELFAALRAGGVDEARVTLHVGAGTFLPVQCERLEEHRMHAERFELPAATVERVAATRARGGRVVCVGTTSVRTLESCVGETGALEPRAGTTELFLRPGSTFAVTDALLTNFHLPKSTLLMLVAALCGRERLLRLYAEAIERGYRFYSYGDAMLLLP